MKVSNRTLTEHLQLLTPLFFLITAIWLLRIILEWGGAPVWLVSVFSVTIGVAASVVLATVIIHIRQFGSYGSVVLSVLLLVTYGQLLIVLSILFTLATGVDTVYTHLRYSLPDDPHHIHHILGHLSIGLGSGILLGSLMGCFLFYFLRTQENVPER